MRLPTAKNRASWSCQRITWRAIRSIPIRVECRKCLRGAESEKKFWQGESMVDERIVAILPHWESIIDAMLTGLGESVAVVHVILISWALVDSRGRATRRARARDA
jgi:hypothetical protein